MLTGQFPKHLEGVDDNETLVTEHTVWSVIIIVGAVTVASDAESVTS